MRLRGALLVAALLAPAAARAEPTPRAQELFAEGRAALDRGELDVACARFGESLALKDAVGPLLNLADCEERRGRLVRARELWKKGAAKLEATDPRREVASGRARALDAKLARVHLSWGAAGPVPGAVLRVDGAAHVAGEPLDPGRHDVVIAVPGEPERRLSVTLAAGEDLALPALLPRRRDDGLLAGGVALAVLGAAGAITFAATIPPFLDRKAIVDRDCPDRRCASQAALDAAREGQALGVANAVGLGVALAGLGAGAALFGLWGSRRGAPVAAAVAPSPGGALGVVTGRF